MKKGFTLAEVLITLAIIGVVAALTIPSVVSKYKERATVTKLKKIYSTLSNAYNLAMVENGEVLNWLSADKTAKENQTAFFEVISPYLNISKVCEYDEGCVSKGKVKNLDGSDYSDYDKIGEYKFVLNDGTIMIFYIEVSRLQAGDSFLGNIKVDIDGQKGENTFGKDFFVFMITSKGIIPAGQKNNVISGTDDEGNTVYYTFEDYCNISGTLKGNGVYCTAWVIENENMDYLHCSDLSWDGKHRCSDD